jgi:hypothetical protein
MTVQRLAQDADAVFMDLRGFTASNSGCIFEIRLLVHVIALDRVVLLIDEATDMALLKCTPQDAWQTLPLHSPNSTVAMPIISLLRASASCRQTVRAAVVLLGLGRDQWFCQFSRQQSLIA